MPLSPAQQRLWFLNRVEAQDAAAADTVVQAAESVYNLPVVLRLRGRLDVAALKRAVMDVLAIA